MQVFDLPHSEVQVEVQVRRDRGLHCLVQPSTAATIFSGIKFFLQNIENIEHIVASFSQAQRQQYFQVLILPSFFVFSCFSSFSWLCLSNGVKWRENWPNQLAGVKDQGSISLTFLEQFVLVKKGT